MKHLVGVITLIALAGCGNPHLRDSLKDKTGNSSSLRVAPDLIITTLDGSRSLEVSTSEPSTNGGLRVTNPNADEVIVDYRFERGLNFRFNGGRFPGLNGNCARNQLPSASCILDIEFFASAPGTYTDNLIATYALRSRPQDVQTRIIPLFGERTATPLRPGRLVLADLAGRAVDFGTVTLGDQTQRLVEIRNVGELPANITGRDIVTSVFTFTGGSFPGTRGTCASLVRPGSCLLDLTFTPTDVGPAQGSLELSYDDNQSLEIGLSGAGIRVIPEVCYATEEITVPAQVTPNADDSGVEFPYHTSVPGSSVRLPRLYGVETNSRNRELKIDTVDNAQVYVTFAIPAVVGEITEVNLELDASKVLPERENRSDVEAVCLSSQDVRKCSGSQDTSRSWQRLRNEAFWTPVATPVNGVYETQYARSASRCGGRYTCSEMNGTFSVDGWFGLSSDERQTLADNKVTFIFVDDTRLMTLPILKLKTKKPVACN